MTMGESETVDAVPPLDLHYWPTPNGWKVTIMLAECGLPYRLLPVDITRGEQFRPEFLAISPNNRMPALVDREPPGGHAGDAPLTLFESGAILQYLADRVGRFCPPPRFLRSCSRRAPASGSARARISCTTRCGARAF